jgi:hypothetical protein
LLLLSEQVSIHTPHSRVAAVFLAALVQMLEVHGDEGACQALARALTGDSSDWLLLLQRLHGSCKLPEDLVSMVAFWQAPGGELPSTARWQGFAGRALHVLAWLSQVSMLCVDV